MHSKISDWKHKGIYLVKNPETVRQCFAGSKQDIVFKTKTTRPILYLCEIENYNFRDIVRLNLINPESQFDAAKHRPLNLIRKTYYQKDQQECHDPVDISSEDFILLGTDVHDLYGTSWGSVLLPFHSKISFKEVMGYWGPFAAQNGFVASENPFYLSKKDRELSSATDFLNQTIKVGDQVIYTLCRLAQSLEVGTITRITLGNVVINNQTTIPHKCVIKYPKNQ